MACRLVRREVTRAGVVCLALGVLTQLACGGAPDSTARDSTPPQAQAGAATPSTSPPAAQTSKAVPSGATSGAAADIAPPAPPAGLDLRQSPDVPLATGLVIVTAVAEDRGDYESVIRVAMGDDRIEATNSATVPVNGQPTEFRSRRIVLNRDRKSARIYRLRWLIGRTELVRGTTAFGVSAEVLEELRTVGRSECSLAAIEEADTLIGAMGLASPEYEGALERVEPAPVPVPVLLDGQQQWLPAIHARGRFEGLTGDVDAEFWLLDNPDNPLTLRGAVGSARLVVVRIDRPPTATAPSLEAALAREERVELPGVYFEFASARLRPESDEAIALVADLLRRHPDWTLRLEGHTDSVGGAEANLSLSQQRADAVRAAIVARLGGGADRLEAAGYGLTRPRDTNDTREGRARNRRVEMARLR